MSINTAARRRRRRHVGIAIALAATGLPAMAAASSSDAAPLACGSVVTTDVRLSADLVDCPEFGLVIGAPGITVDLNGHTIRGTGAVGIDNNGHDGVRITGGRVSGFTQGVGLLETSGGRIDRMTLDANANGINISRGDHVEIERVDAVANTTAGIEITFSEHVTVRRSSVSGSGFGGIVDRFSTANRYERNVLFDNLFFGITLDSAEQAVLVRNTVVSNEFDGIQVGFRTTDAVLERNRTDGNGDNGIVIDEPGNTLARHEAFGNGGIGIAAPDSTIDGGRNRAAGNAGGDCTGVACG